MRPALLGALAVVASCGGGQTGTTTPTPPPPDEAPPADGPPPAVRPADGVTAMTPACVGSEERCNAVDDDCDGRVDEGCPYASASALWVTAAWNTGADVDVLLGADGQSTHDGRGDCGDDEEHPRVDHARRDRLDGPVEVRVRHSDACDDEAPTTVTVTVGAGEATLAVLNVGVAVGQEVVVAVVGGDAPASGPPAEPASGELSDGPPEDWTTCSSDRECVAVEMACCDACNGGVLWIVNAERFSDARAGAATAARCEGARCTRMGCAAPAPACREGRCVDTRSVAPGPR